MGLINKAEEFKKNMKEYLFSYNDKLMDMQRDLTHDDFDFTEIIKIIKDDSYILFSDECPVETYGIYSMEYIKKEIASLIQKINNLLEEIGEKEYVPYLRSLINMLSYLLEHENNYEKNIERILLYIKELLAGFEGEESDSGVEITVLLEAYKKVLKERKFLTKVLGRYNQKDNTITLYIRNIFGLKANGEIPLFEKLSKVDKDNFVRIYAHEMQHLFQFNTGYCPYDSYADEVVIESLAKFFECYFDENVLGNRNNDISKLFLNYSVTTYPCVGAWYIESYYLWHLQEKDCYKFLTKAVSYPPTRYFTSNGAICFLLAGTKELKEIL